MDSATDSTRRHVAPAPAGQKSAGQKSAAPSTRGLILDVAAARFAELGFRSTSVSAVARELSLSPSAIYFHFANKEQLFVAAYDRQAGRLADAVFTGEPEPVGDGYWQSIIVEFVRRVADYPLVLRVVRGGEPDLMPRLATGELSARLRAALATSLRKGQEIGRVRTDIDRERVAGALESILLALLVTTIQAGGSSTGDRARPVVELLLMALEVRSGES